MKPDKNGSRALSASYVRHIHMVLHEALEAACGARLIAKNPTKGTVIPRMERKEMRVLNDEQLDRFLSAAGADPFWCDFFYLELTTGLRRGEICGLRWEDFDAASGMLYVRRSVSADGWRGRNYGETKTKAGRRDILLPESAKERLELRKKSSYSEWMQSTEKRLQIACGACLIRTISQMNQFIRLWHLPSQTELALLFQTLHLKFG